MKSNYDQNMNNFLEFFSRSYTKKIPKTCILNISETGKITGISNTAKNFLNIPEEKINFLNIKEILFSKRHTAFPVSLEEILKDESFSKDFHCYLKDDNSKFIPLKLNINLYSSNDKETTYTLILSDINNDFPKNNGFMEESFQKDAILQAIIFVCERILQSTENISEAIIYDTIKHIGVATRSHRVLIFENEINEYSSKIMQLKYEWHSPKLFRIKESSSLNRYRYPDTVFNILSKGNHIQNATDDLNENTALILRDHMIGSFILFPLIFQNNFFGVLAIADCNRRQWQDNAIEGLASSARLLAKIINKIRYGNTATGKKNTNSKPDLNPVCLVDKNGKILFTSIGFENELGYSSAEIAGLPINAFIESEQGSFFNIFKNVIYGNKEFEDIDIYIRKSNERKNNCKLNIKKLEGLNNSDPVVKLSIQGKKHNQDRISADDGFYIPELVDKLHIPLWITDKKKQFIYANHLFYEKILNINEKKFSVIDKCPDDFPSNLGFLMNLIENDIAEKQSSRIEREAETFKITMSPAELKQENNDDLFYLWTAEDISDAVQNEKEIKVLKRQFSTICENIPAAIFLKDVKGQYIYANRYMRENYDIKSIPASPEETFPDHLITKFTMEDLKVMREGLVETIDSLKTMNNTIATFKKFKFKLIDKDSEPLICGVAIDITREQKAEQTVIKLGKDIETLKAGYENQLFHATNVRDKKYKIARKKLDQSRLILKKHLHFIQNTPMIVFSCSIEGRINSIHGSFRKILGKDIKKQYFHSLLDEKSTLIFHEEWKKLLQKDKENRFLNLEIKKEPDEKIQARIIMRLDEKTNSEPEITISAVFPELIGA